MRKMEDLAVTDYRVAAQMDDRAMRKMEDLGVTNCRARRAKNVEANG